MSVINKLLFLLGVELYAVHFQSFSGAYTVKIGSLDQLNDEFKVYTYYAANRRIKQLDAEHAAMMKKTIEEAYPELIDEL